MHFTQQMTCFNEVLLVKVVKQEHTEATVHHPLPDCSTFWHMAFTLCIQHIYAI